MKIPAHQVLRGTRRVHLRPTEFHTLRFLLQRPQRVFSRVDLMKAIWGADTQVEPRTIDVHILQLRKTLNAPGKIDMVRTVRGAGYALDEVP